LTETEAAAARTQPSFHQFSAWLAAFNSGDQAQYRQFPENNFPPRVSNLDQEMNFHARVDSSSGSWRQQEVEWQFGVAASSSQLATGRPTAA